MDWWDRDTPEDQALLRLIDVAKRLVHLPKREEIPEAQRGNIIGSCVTYFGSFEKALRQAAKLLYGHADLTSPDDLLPNERGLSEAEQAEVLDQRRKYYQEMLKRLGSPGALVKMRRERAAEEERRRRLKQTEGYTVRQIPIQTRQQMRAVIGEERLLEEARGTSGLFVRKPEEQAAPKQQKGRPSFREQWEKSSLNPANQPKMVRTSKPKASVMSKKPELPIRKGDDEMGGPRVTKEKALEVVAKMYKHYGHIPTRLEMEEYAEAHSLERIPHFTTLGKFLGPKETWAAQLEDYRREKRLTTEAPKEQNAAAMAAAATLVRQEEAEAPDSTVPEAATPGEPAETSGVTPESVAEPEAGDPCTEQVGSSSTPGVTPGSGADVPGATGMPAVPDLPATEVIPDLTGKAEEAAEEDDTKVYHPSDLGSPALGTAEALESPAPAKEVKKLKINLLGATVRLLVGGQEYEVELEFGRD